MREFLRLRHRLIPYLYTMNYRAYAEGMPLITPLYYHHTWRQEFERVRNEYYYGTEMIVNPITSPEIPGICMGKTSTWLPEGIFTDFFTGMIYQGGERVMDLYRPLDSIPVLVKAGGIIPMTEEISGKEASDNPEKILLRVFAGSDGKFSLYEDDNETTDYENGNCAVTDYVLTWNSEKKFEIRPVRGNTKWIPEKRTYLVEWNNVEFHTDTDMVMVTVNDIITAAKTEYNQQTGRLFICLSDITPVDRVSITLSESAGLHKNPTEIYSFTILERAEIDFNVKNAVYQTITSTRTITEKLSCIQAMNLDRELQGALTEVLTAQSI